MNDHKPECVLSDPCSADEPRHGYCGNSDRSWCMHCEEACDCARIQRAEQRVSGEFLTPMALAATGLDDPRYAKGYAAGLDAAREAVAALDVPADWIGSTRHGLDNALAAIDALKEKT